MAHHKDTGIQEHSVGDLYPFIVFAIGHGPEQNTVWHVLDSRTSRTVTSNGYLRQENAVRVARDLKWRLDNPLFKKVNTYKGFDFFANGRGLFNITSAGGVTPEDGYKDIELLLASKGFDASLAHLFARSLFNV